MRAEQLLRPCVTLMLAVSVTAATAQPRREVAPIVDVVPDGVPKRTESAAPAIMPVPNVVGLSFDEARARLTGFDVRRSYRASSEPGGMVLAQEPAPAVRLAAGAPVRVVLSDGSLRQAPRVAESEIDGVRKPLEAPTPPAVVSTSPEVPTPQQARTAPAVPAPVVRQRDTAKARTVAAAQAPAVQRKSTVQSRAPAPRARAKQLPAPNAVASTRPAPVAETIEMPNVVGRSDADASRLLAEFKVDRIEVMASAAPSGQVLAQDPPPGTAVAPGSKIGLQVSDGSLANPAATTPAVSSPPSPAAPSVQTPTETAAPAPRPIRSDRSPITSADNAALMLVVAVLLGLLLGAWLMRRRVLSREPAVDATPAAPVVVLTAAPVDLAPPEPSTSRAPVPEITVVARLDAGETTIEFTAQPDADETTLEHSRELHE